MNDAISVAIPSINVNDDIVTLTVWRVSEGDEVSRGQDIAGVETSEAAAEIVAPASGKIFLKSAAGAELSTGSVIAYIDAAVPSAASIGRADAITSIHSAAAPTAIPTGAPTTRFSRRAQKLMERHNLPATLFDATKLVQKRDVLDHVKRTADAMLDASEIHPALKNVAVGGVTFPAIFADDQSGKVDPAFLRKLLNNSESFKRLQSERKCRIYREHGAHIGEEVVIGKDTILIAPTIQIDDGVQLGDNSTFILTERLAIGALSTFHDDLSIQGGTAVFGVNTIAGSRIRMEGSGHFGSSQLLVAGDNVTFGDDVSIDVSRPVLIGKEVSVRQRSILITHSAGHSALDGHSTAFAPTVLEDFSELGINSTLDAGSRVGRSAIVSPNSYVLSSIPQGKLAMGVPASAVGDAANPIDRANQLEIAETMIHEFRDLLAFKGVRVSPVKVRPFVYFTAECQSRSMCLIFMEREAKIPAELHHSAETVVWTFETAPISHHPEVAYMDLLNKTICNSSGIFADTTREYLRSRGIRLEPGPWRYERGLI